MYLLRACDVLVLCWMEEVAKSSALEKEREVGGSVSSFACATLGKGPRPRCLHFLICKREVMYPHLIMLS